MRLISRGAPDPAMMGRRKLIPVPADKPWLHTWCRPRSSSHREGYYQYDVGPIPLRVTPPGERKVPEILRPGAVVRTSYGSGPYTVVLVDGPYFFHPPEEAAAYEIWSLHGVSPKEWAAGRRDPSAWINDLVAVGGRILTLFSNNTDEVLIEGPAPSEPYRKPVQMELFA